MVKQCAGTVEQSWWNSRTVMVGQCGGRWNSKVEQCGGTVKQS